MTATAVMRRGPTPVTSASDADGVSCRFAGNAVEVTYAPPKPEGARIRPPVVRWSYKALGGDVDPEACTFRVGGPSLAPPTNTKPPPEGSLVVQLKLRKATPTAVWNDIGTRLWNARKDLRVISVGDYSWSDLYQGAKVYIKIPGVHTLPPEAVRVRFRELSFDVCAGPLPAPNAPPGAPADCEYRFAVTELPLEIIVDKCNYRVDDVDGGRVKVYVRKWAKTAWMKLAVHREALWLDDALKGSK